MKVLVCGPFNGHENISKKIRFSPNKNDIFGEFNEIISNCDISIYNQEFPMTNSQVRNKTKKFGPITKSDPVCIKSISAAGFTHATLATNHIYDYGEEGLKDTIETCKQNDILPFGAGININEARRPLIVEKDNIKLAFINICEHEFNIADSDKGGANPLDIIENTKQIIELKKNNDFVFVIIHGGTDYCEYPSPRMVNQYRFYAEIGASAVIGHHAHIVSGFEEHIGVPIFYQIGNLIPGNLICNNGDYSMPIEFEITKGSKLKWRLYYLYFNRDELILKILKEKQETIFKAHIADISKLISNQNELYKRWGDFISSKWRASFYFTLFTRSEYFLFRIFKKINALNLYYYYISKKMRNNKINSGLWNIVRCETHQDVLNYYFEKYINK